MTTLIHHPNVVVAHDQYHEWHAYYLLPRGAATFLDVPAGGKFGIVHTPAPYTTDLYYGKWTYTVFKVIERRLTSWDTLPERYYPQQSTRELTDEERAYFESITPAPLEREKEIQS